MKTLVIRLSSIGDILQATPIIRCLKKKFPDATIDFCVFREYADVLWGNPHISNIIPVDRSRPLAEAREQIKSQEIYDCVVDLHNNFRSRALRRVAGENIFIVNKRTFQRWLLVKTKINLLRNEPDVIGRYFETVLPLGVTDDKQGMEFYGAISEKEKNELISSFNVNNKFLLALCPGAKYFTKRWLPERFAELALSFIQKKNATVLLFGGKDDAEVCEKIYRQVSAVFPNSIRDMSGKCPLAEVAAMMQMCDCVVTNDSALMHVASSQKKPLVAIFGSTVKEFGFAPASQHSIVVENKDLYCRPCTHTGRNSCPKGHFKCMVDIGTAEVTEAIENVLS